MPIGIFDVLADYFQTYFVFRLKEILNSVVTHRARCIQDEVTLAHLSHFSFLEDCEVLLIIRTTRGFFRVEGSRVS